MGLPRIRRTAATIALSFVVSVASIASVPSPARAAEPPIVELTWIAEPSCPNREAVLSEIKKLVRASPPNHPLVARAEVSHDEVWNIVLETRLGDRVGSRRIEAEFDTFTGDDHVFRLQGGSSGQPGIAPDTLGQFTNNSYVAENTSVTPAAVTGTAGGLFRGENTNSVYVDNTVNRSVVWAPQNSAVIEHVSLGLAEGNTFYDADYDPNYACVGITAQHIVIRNNLCVSAGKMININGNPLMPVNWTDQIYVYNNTHYINEPNGYPTQIAQIGYGNATSGSMTFRNNISWTSSTSNQSQIYIDYAASATVTTDHNDIYAPNGDTLTAPTVGTGGIVTDPKFVSTTVGAAGAFTLDTGSPAIDSGTNTHVYQSFGIAPGRPQNAAWDMGAFERKSP